MGFNELITAAQTGDAYAQFELGSSYYYGNGTPIDKMKAVEWWKNAQFELAKHYNLGIGVPENPAKATEWLEKTAKKWTLKCANCFRTSLLPR